MNELAKDASRLESAAAMVAQPEHVAVPKLIFVIDGQGEEQKKELDRASVHA